MTFSIIARCAETGAFGAAITTSNLAVGSRCVRLSHGVGAFLSQHRTDPRLGDLGITCLNSGDDAGTAVDKVRASTADIEWRQLGALDRAGRTAVYHGRRMYSIYSHSTAPDCLAIGNILANDKVTDHMADAFSATAEEPLAERLMRSLEAGRDAGGEILGPLRSASLRVTGEMNLDECDLRIDRAAGDAVGELRDLFAAYCSEGKHLRNLAIAPETLPVSRRLFDASVARISELNLQDRFPTERTKGDWRVSGES